MYSFKIKCLIIRWFLNVKNGICIRGQEGGWRHPKCIYWVNSSLFLKAMFSSLNPEEALILCWGVLEWSRRIPDAFPTDVQTNMLRCFQRRLKSQCFMRTSFQHDDCLITSFSVWCRAAEHQSTPLSSSFVLGLKTWRFFHCEEAFMYRTDQVWKNQIQKLPDCFI